MADRPIIFSAPMIRAILAGRKTQTRRTITPKPFNAEGDCVNIDMAPTARFTRGADGRFYFAFDHPGGGPLTAYVSPYAPGDRLWVRETFITGWPLTDDAPDQYDENGNENPLTVWYRATSDINRWMDEDGNYRDSIPWRPSIFMPRWASRITLHVTDVRVQRLAEITSADAISEGFRPHANSQTIDCDTPDPRDDFARFWGSINGSRAGASWSDNPWIVAVSFRPELRNIDQCEAA